MPGFYPITKYNIPYPIYYNETAYSDSLNEIFVMRGSINLFPPRGANAWEVYSKMISDIDDSSVIQNYYVFKISCTVDKDIPSDLFFMVDAVNSSLEQTEQLFWRFINDKKFLLMVPTFSNIVSYLTCSISPEIKESYALSDYIEMVRQ